MTLLQDTLKKLIKDNWPGMEGRYRFTIPCPTIKKDGKQCTGRFIVKALQEFLAKGAGAFPCQECYQLHSISDLLLGFEERSLEEQLRELQREMLERFDGLDSRIANYFMAMMRAIADEAKAGPRLFTLRSVSEGIVNRELELQLWCEAEGCQHPVMEPEKGTYPLKISQEWVVKVAPYASFALGVLKTVAPVAGPAINTFFGPDTTKLWGIKDQLDLAKSVLGQLPKEIQAVEHGLSPRGMLRDNERAGLLALHSMLKELDPHQESIGLHRISTYTGDYRWLCKDHYEAWQPKIPDVIEGTD